MVPACNNDSSRDLVALVLCHCGNDYGVTVIDLQAIGIIKVYFVFICAFGSDNTDDLDGIRKDLFMCGFGCCGEDDRFVFFDRFVAELSLESCEESFRLDVGDYAREVKALNVVYTERLCLFKLLQGFNASEDNGKLHADGAGDKLFERIFAIFTFQHFGEGTVKLEISRGEFRKGRVSVGVAVEMIQCHIKSGFGAKLRIMLDVVLIVAGGVGGDLDDKLGTIYIVFGRDGHELVEEILVRHGGAVEVAGDV